MLLSLILTLIFRDPFIGDWDALDYTVLSVRGAPSSMALGRVLFVGYNHALWRVAHDVFGLSAAHAYLLFQFVIIAQVPLAVMACGALARAVTGSQQAATLAALLVGTSPVFVLYGGQVMTEIPSLLLSTCALLLYWRGIQARRGALILLGAALLGVGVNLRETVAFYGVWLVLAPLAARWSVGRREIFWLCGALLVFAACAFGPFGLLYGLDLGGYRASWYGWLASMKMEAAQHPVTWRNLGPFLGLFALNAPLVFFLGPLALWREARRHGFTPSFALGLAGVIATALLFFNYSTTINARYFLTGLPALAPLIGKFLDDAATARARGNRRRGFVWACVLVCVLALGRDAWLFRQQARLRAQRLGAKDYLSQLAQVPPDATMLAGGQTVAVTYWRGLGYGNWQSIGTGGGWPGVELVPVIERGLSGGQRIFLDADPRWWAVCGWQAAETRALPILEQHFRFRRVNATLYEIRPPTATDAPDTPNLNALLPENRPADMRLCFSLSH